MKTGVGARPETEKMALQVYFEAFHIWFTAQKAKYAKSKKKNVILYIRPCDHV